MLEWTDILWDVSKFRVTSPKTEHHEGKAERLVPIFPELLPYLREAFEKAPEGSRYVINRTRDPKVNWRTQILRIIRKAGLTPWPKPFQNMRATRETELADQFPAHVVTAWIGNSERVATDHYLQITEEHWNRGAESGALPAQKPSQQGAARPAQNVADLPEVLAGCEDMREAAAFCDIQEYARSDSNTRPSV
jgi:integrase